MAFDCIERAIRLCFFNYGGFIAKHPFPFLIVPVLLAGALGAGIVFLTEEQNVEALYTPENGQAKTDRATVEKLFAQNGKDDQLAERLTRYGNAIVRMEDGGNILTESGVRELINLHDKIMNISVFQNDTEYTFLDLCVKVDGVCNENALIAVYGYNSSQVSEIALTYPLYRPTVDTVFFLGGGLGGVTLKPGSTDEVLSGEAVLLAYLLQYEDTADDLRGAMWEKAFIEVVAAFNPTGIRVTRFVSTSLEDELTEASANLVRDFSITFAVFITFTILSCMMFDWVRSKPWLAACGVISACLSLVTSFGLMSYIGVPYANIVGAAPFLILGIGVDDTFIMVAAWRKTDSRLAVEDRMREAFSEAAMSITITSITDALAFGVGTITYFQSVRIFCLYLGSAVLVDYMYQITFFGACMVLTGRREAANRHCLSCNKVKSKEESGSKTYTLFCAGGASQQPSDMSVKETNDHALMIFFKKYYGPFITRPWMAMLTVVLYAGYLATSIYGCTQLGMGLSLRNLARDNSYAANYKDDARAYFTSYGPQVALVFSQPRDMWHPTIQDVMEKTLVSIEESQYVYSKNDSLSVSWLRDYLAYLELINVKEPTQAKFIDTLRDNFLKLPAFQHYSPDIIFSDDGLSIDTSRFFVTTKDLDSTNKERFMMTELREIAENAQIPAIVYHPAFVFFDQFIAIFPNTMQNLGIAVGAMMFVALLMIPNPICSILVTLSLISIVAGVIGSMALWDVNLDNISMINLIICIGFSVDFSAHISYAYISGNTGSRRENAINALYSIGMPIVQGSLSTILGILILAFSDTYIFRTFFKTMFLVICLGALHGIFFLPVFLMLTIPVKARAPPESVDKNDRKGHPFETLHESRSDIVDLRLYPSTKSV